MTQPSAVGAILAYAILLAGIVAAGRDRSRLSAPAAIHRQRRNGGYRFAAGGTALVPRLHSLFPDARRFFVLAVPGLVAAGIPQLKLIAGAMVASSSQAAVSWLYYANRLYELPLGVISIAIASVLVPAIAASVRSGTAASAAAQSRGFEIAIGLALPSAVGFAVLAEPIAAALFERGAFGRAIPQRSPRRSRRSAPACPATRSRRYSARCRSRMRTRARRCLLRSSGLRPPSSDRLRCFPLRPRRRGGGDCDFRLGRRDDPRHDLAATGWLRLDRDAARRLPRIVLAAVVMGLSIFAVLALLAPLFNASGSLARMAALARPGRDRAWRLYLASLEVLGVARMRDLLAAVRKPRPRSERSSCALRPRVMPCGGATDEDPGMAFKERVFSGVQPTGNLHLGNYLGAHREIRRAAGQATTASIAWSICTRSRCGRIRPSCRRRSARSPPRFIACGIDPKKHIVFNQSQVAEHAELAWVFNCVARLGWLNRMTQFKEKAGKDRENASVGLYAYPTLMAADILVYRATHVPVGEDQKQHLELSRDIAQKFNNDFAESIQAHGYGDAFFPQPEPLIQGPATRVMSLRDGSKKMSKSDASDQSRINLTDDADAIAHKIRRAKTDPGAAAERGEGPRAATRGRQPGRHLRGARRRRARRRCCREFGGAQFSTFKAALVDLAVAKLGPINAEMKRLVADPVYIDPVLADGAARAQVIAAETMKAVKDIVGFVRR